jgi:hypothetical protein
MERKYSKRAPYATCLPEHPCKLHSKVEWSLVKVATEARRLLACAVLQHLGLSFQLFKECI